MGNASISARNAIVFFSGFFPLIKATLPVLATVSILLIPNSINVFSINVAVSYSLNDNSGWACKWCLMFISRDALV